MAIWPLEASAPRRSARCPVNVESMSQENADAEENTRCSDDLGHGFPPCLNDAGKQLFGDEARPGGIEMTIVLRVLDEEALRHDQMEVILCAGHGDVEQSAFAIAVSARRRYAPTQ
jgi:hypothetical protein